jgi:cyclopropane-fatty-acyl-phospholipid synthase
MRSPGHDVSGRALQRTWGLLRELFADYHPRDFAVRLWDGATWNPENGETPRFTLILRHPGALRRMLLPGTEIGISEAYLYDDFDIEGDMTAIFSVAERLLALRLSWLEKLRYGKELLRLPSKARVHLERQPARLHGKLHSKQRDHQAVTYHYDLSNEFYSLLLDDRMIYSCAYFKSHFDSLEQAQEQKLEHICRKLRFRPGDRLLDIGCGWGGLIIFACQRYRIEAVGVTLSRRQADFANQRILQAGLSDRCRVEVLDYRDLKGSNEFDRLVSVGMVEHVGAEKLLEYFQHAWTLLKPGGLFLNHGISFTSPQPLRRGPTFFDRYVFPDGELVPLSMITQAMEASRLEILDVEGLREHYVLTLRHWLRNLEGRQDEIRRLTDETTFRVWRLYISAAMQQFAVGRTTLYQLLASKPTFTATEQPLTRADWYTRV